MFFWLLKLGTAFLLAYVGVKILNSIFPSVRPFIADGVTALVAIPNTPSFPSSHAADAAILASFIWKLRQDWGVVGFIAVALIGYGRVAAHLHYPVDILGGVALGIAVSYLVLHFWPRRLV